jgi:hypothetical protein
VPRGDIFGGERGGDHCEKACVGQRHYGNLTRKAARGEFGFGQMLVAEAKRMNVCFPSISGNVGNTVRDLYEIVVDRFLNVAIELAPLDGGEDLQRLVDVGADMDSRRDFLGIAKAFAGDGVAAFALRDKVSKLRPAS